LSREIERAAQAAINKHNRLLHHKTLELVLGAMVEMDGVRSVRKVLLWYARHLREFDNGDSDG
jgi:hypothetical protein